MKKFFLMMILTVMTQGAISQNVGVSDNVNFTPQYTLDVDGILKIANYGSVGVNPNSSYRFYAYNSSSNYARLGSNQYGLYARGSSSAVWGFNNTANGHAVRAQQGSGGFSIYADGVNSRNYFQGNVGIGETNPVNRLQVNGNSRFGTSANNYVYLASGATTGNGGLEIFTSGNVGYIRYHDPFVAWRDISLNDAGGNVGVGTTTPSQKLHIGNIQSGDGILIGQYNNQMGWDGTGGSPFYAIKFSGYRDVVTNFTGAMITGTRTNICCNGLSQGMELDFWVQPNTATVSGDGNLVNRARVFGGGIVAWDYYYLSDRRIKSNISDLDYGLDEITKLHPKRYDQHRVRRMSHVSDYDGYEESFGFIAQDVLSIIPEIIGIPTTEDGLYTISYAKLTPILVNAIKEQNRMIKELEIRLTIIESCIE